MSQPVLLQAGMPLAAGLGPWALGALYLPQSDPGFPGAVICSAAGWPLGAWMASPFAASLTMNIAMATAMLILAAGMAAFEGGLSRPCLPSLVSLVLRWAAWAVACAAFSLPAAGPELDRLRAVTVAMLVVVPMVPIVPTGRDHRHGHDAGWSVGPAGRPRQPAWTRTAGLRQNAPCMTVMALAGMSLSLVVGASVAMAIRAAWPRSPASRVAETLALTAGLGLALL